MQEANRFWLHPRFEDLGLFRARFRHHRYALHTHPTYVVALITAGCERVRVGRRSVLAPAGSAFVVNREEWHDGEAAAEAGWSYRTFYPSTDLIDHHAAELGQDRAPLFPRAVLDDPALARMLATAHEQSLSPDSATAEESMLVALRRLILRHADWDNKPEWLEGSGSRRRLARYREIIEANLTDSLTLQRLAAAGGVTRFQVIRDFKKILGLTPARFIRDRRLRRAGTLIEQGASLAQAAADAGFADQSHLSRTFRAARGLTPGMLARALQARPRIALPGRNRRV